MRETFWIPIPRHNEDSAYVAGYDCGMNGADDKNCHFSIFSSPENTMAWEKGKREAERCKYNPSIGLK